MNRLRQDDLPHREPQPRPEGWFEVGCCAAIVLTLLAVLLAVALLR